MKTIDKNYILYFLIVSPFFILKNIYTFLNAEDLKIFLSAYNFIIEIVTGSSSVYINQKGYYYKSLNIIIDKSCSGYNLWLIFYLIISVLLINVFQQIKHKIAGVFISLIIAYFSTIVANSARIITSIFLQDQLLNYIKINSEILHQSLGVLNNLFFLVLFYLLTKHIITKYLKNA